MALSQAEKQKRYRSKKSNAPVTESNVLPTETLPHSNAPLDISTRLLRDVELKPRVIPATVLIGTKNGSMGRTTDDTNITNPNLNYGPYMTADELAVFKANHSLKKYHNRVPIPGDADYIGVAV